MIKKPLIVTRGSIEDNTKNNKVHLECVCFLDPSILNGFVGQEKKTSREDKDIPKHLNGFTKWVVDQWSSLPNDIVEVTNLHI